MKILYLPFGKLNLVGSCDIGLILPVAIQQKFKYFPDFSQLNPLIMYVTSKPALPATEVISGKSNETLILELKVPDAFPIFEIEGASLKPVLELNSDDPARPLCITDPIPLNYLRRVLIPASAGQIDLADNPFLDEMNVKLESRILEESPKFFSLYPKLSDELALDLEEKSKKVFEDLQIAGGFAMCGFLLNGEQPPGIMAPAVESFLDAVCRFVLSPKPIPANVSCGKFQFFHVPGTELDFKGFFPAVLSSQSEFSSFAIDQAVYMRFLQVARDSSASVSPTKILRMTMESIQHEIDKTESQELKQKLKKFSDSLKEAEKAYKGLVSAEKMFEPKYKPYRAVRAAQLFLMRNEPATLIHLLESGELPGQADALDVIGAAFLAGTYRGYQLLPPAVKRSWRCLTSIKYASIHEDFPFAQINDKWIDSGETVEGIWGWTVTGKESGKNERICLKAIVSKAEVIEKYRQVLSSKKDFSLLESCLSDYFRSVGEGNICLPEMGRPSSDIFLLASRNSRLILPHPNKFARRYSSTFQMKCIKLRLDKLLLGDLKGMPINKVGSNIVEVIIKKLEKAQRIPANPDVFDELFKIGLSLCSGPLLVFDLLELWRQMLPVVNLNFKEDDKLMDLTSSLEEYLREYDL